MRLLFPQKSPPAARGGRAGGPATQKGTYLAPDHADFTAQISHVESPPLETPPSHKNGKKQHTEDRHAVESAAKAPRQRKEVRVRPGFGAYRAPSHPPADGATSSLEVMQESGTRFDAPHLLPHPSTPLFPLCPSSLSTVLTSSPPPPCPLLPPLPHSPRVAGTGHRRFFCLLSVCPASFCLLPS